MTDATIKALQNLRDVSTLKWYVIPLLAIVFYIYTLEIKKAKKSGNWNAVLSGLTILGVDFFNETWNSWVMVLTERSAFWTAPGDTALRILVGWNIEILFMFSLVGIIFYNTIKEELDGKILGIQDYWVFAAGYSAFCVFVECFLNIGGLLIWEYSFWGLSFKGVWLIFLIGYFHFFCAAIFVITRKSLKTKLITVSVIYLVPVIMNIAGLGIFGWNY